MEINVRGYIRILGVLLSILGYVAVVLMLAKENSLDLADYAFIFTTSLFFFPLVFLSSILGRVPYFISKYIPKEMEDDITKAESFFTEFSPKSFWFAFGFMIVAFITGYFWG